MSFLWGMTGLSLRDRVRSLIISDAWTTSGGRPDADPGHAEEIYVSWLVWERLEAPLKLLDKMAEEREDRMSVPCNPDVNKQQKNARMFWGCLVTLNYIKLRMKNMHIFN